MASLPASQPRKNSDKVPKLRMRRTSEYREDFKAVVKRFQKCRKQFALPSIRFPSIRAKMKAQRPEGWFWRLVFVGVVCDFLYLGWLALRSLRVR